MTNSKQQQKALETADLSIWATSILMVCGYALKEMLTETADGSLGEIADITHDLSFIFNNELADEIVQKMIYRAVEIFGIIDEHGFQDEDDIAKYLKEHDQQPQKQTDTD